MSLSHAILGVLSTGPLHGYAVRAALGERIGSFWPVNQGQVYAILGRLAREGLADERAAQVAGGARRVYAISEKGRAALTAWLAEPLGSSRHDGLGFDDWAAHLVVCERRGDTTLLRATLDVQRRRCETLLHTMESRAAGDPALAERAAREILEAELHWLDLAERELIGPASDA